MTYDSRNLTDSVEGFRALALRHRLHVRYRSEFPRHTDNRGLCARYFSKRGISPDALGEFWFDSGLLDSRPSVREVLDRLDAIFEQASRRAPERSESAVWNAHDRERERIAKTRNYQWRCHEGCTNAYAPAGSLFALHALFGANPCPVCGSQVLRRSLTLREFDAGISLSIVNERSYNPCARGNGMAGGVTESDSVPF